MHKIIRMKPHIRKIYFLMCIITLVNVFSLSMYMIHFKFKLEDYVYIYVYVCVCVYISIHSLSLIQINEAPLLILIHQTSCFFSQVPDLFTWNQAWAGGRGGHLPLVLWVHVCFQAIYMKSPHFSHILETYIPVCLFVGVRCVFVWKHWFYDAY